MVSPHHPLPRFAFEIALALALATFAGVLVIYLTGISRGFGNSDEAIYAEFVRTMHRSGDYWTTHFQGQPVLQRPATAIALYAIVSRFVGGEMGIWLAPVILSALAAAAAGAIVWRQTRHVAAGIATMLVCAGAPTYFTYGRLAFSDPPYVLACVGALAATMAAQKNPKAFFWIGVAVGAAIGTKSFAAAIPTVGLLPWTIVAMRKHARRDLRIGWTILAFLALAAPFYVANLIVYGHRFLTEHFGYNLIARAKGLEGIGFGQSNGLSYLRHMWAADGVLLTTALLGGSFAAAALGALKRDAVLAIPATMALTTFVLFSAINTRMPHYLLVFYPPAATCVGLLLGRALVRVKNVAAATGLGAVAAGLGAFVFWTTSGAPSFDANTEASPEAIELGRAVLANSSAGQPIYSFEWYAPALGYYADRDWKMLTTSARIEQITGSVDLFHNAKTVRLAPPWPSGTFLIAGEGRDLAAATRLTPPLKPIRPIARSHSADGVLEYEVWEAAGP